MSHRFNPSESTFARTVRRGSYLCLEVLSSTPVGLRLEEGARRRYDLILRYRGGGRLASVTVITPGMESRRHSLRKFPTGAAVGSTSSTTSWIFLQRGSMENLRGRGEREIRIWTETALAPNEQEEREDEGEDATN